MLLLFLQSVPIEAVQLIKPTEDFIATTGHTYQLHTQDLPTPTKSTNLSLFGFIAIIITLTVLLSKLAPRPDSHKKGHSMSGEAIKVIYK